MIKPLLRTLPSLSGNVKLACTLTDINPISDDNKNWEANIRGALLTPASSQLWQKKTEASLISSTWEYDLPRFYKAYPEVFYKTCFSFDKANILKLDPHSVQELRDRDFEFGVQRVQYSSTNSQFAFFAPIYIDSAADIPDSFVISVKLYNNSPDGKKLYTVTKTIRVNIGVNGAAKENYIYKYLYNYTAKIDNSVAVCQPFTDQATFYGIDLQHSGFVTAIDNMFSSVYRKQNTIQNVDATIALGFSNNKIAMKQIMPLCYCFNVASILTEAEKKRYSNAKVVFSGAYFSGDTKLLLYDFVTDYMQYSEQILKMDTKSGQLKWAPGYAENIMDVVFPSLYDKRYINYTYANKLSPWFCHWKMLYSDDEHPYTVNSSWAYSKNQRSNYKYGQYPTVHDTLPAVAQSISADTAYNYSLTLPLGDINDPVSGMSLYMYAPWYNGSLGPYSYIPERYRQTIEEYCSNWFSVVEGYSDSIFGDTSLWRDTENGHVYYNGMLYDLNKIYSVKSSPVKIDKFAVLLQPVPELFTASTIGDMLFSKYTLNRQVANQVSVPNAVVNDRLLQSSYIPSPSNYIYEDATFSTGSKVCQDKLTFNTQFRRSKNNTGSFINISATAYTATLEDGTTAYGRLPLDYYSLNRYYAAADLNTVKSAADYITASAYATEDPEMQRMVAAYIEPHYGVHGNIPADVLSYAVQAYVSVPISIIDRISYGDLTFTNEEEREAWRSYNTVPIDFYMRTHNSSIINIPPEYASKEYNGYTADGAVYNTLYDAISYNSYIRHASDDPTVMTASRIDGEMTSAAYSYMSTFTAPGTNSQLYFKTGMVSASDIPYIESGFDAYSYLWRAFPDTAAELTDHSLIFTWKDIKETHPAAYWAGRLADYKKKVSDAATAYIRTMTPPVCEYEFIPELQEDRVTVAKDIFKERSSWTGEFYGNTIAASDIIKDNDVIWADPYNFGKLFTYHGTAIPDGAVFKDMYVKFLNKQHLYYWYRQLASDKDGAWGDGTDYAKFSGETWYRHLYAVEKKLVYDCGYTATPQVRLVYTPIEKLLQFPEYYRDADEVTSYSYNTANDPYRSFEVFYNMLRYDSTHDFFTLPGFYNKDISSYGPLKWTEETGASYINSDAEKCFTTEKISYVLDGGMYSERYVECSYTYVGPTGETLYHNEPIEFELVYRKEMYRVEETLWGIMDMADGADKYQDIYLYRFIDNNEHDRKYAGAGKHISFMSGLSYVTADLSQITSYTYLLPIKETRYVNDNPVTYTGYNYGYAYYNTPHILTVDPWSYIHPSDSMLVPLFDDVFVQSADESLIYAHYWLHDISTAYVVGDSPDSDGSFPVMQTNYRYDSPDILMMMDTTEAERERYRFTPTYDMYSNCYSELTVKSDDLNYGDCGLSTKVAADGTVYGFYYIDSHISNTQDSMDIISVSDDAVTSHLRFINYINKVNITEHPEYIAAIYKQLLPFIKHQPLEVMSAVTAAVYPTQSNIDLVYTPVSYSDGTAETDIIKKPNKLRTLPLLRYFTAMTPLIVPAQHIQNEWRLKLKDCDAQLLDTGKHLSTGDTNIYSVPVDSNVFVPYNVYSASADTVEKKSYNNVTGTYTPTEYKFYNTSVYVNLEPHIEVKVPGKLTYSELLEKESQENVTSLFSGYMNSNGHMFTTDETLFLLSKYTVSYDSVPVGLNMQQTEKLYRLTVVFDLR